MKQYKKYMDNIQASDTLHQRLVNLEAPVKHPAAWKKYGGMAAALLLVCGLGGFGAWAAHLNSLEHPIPPYPAGYQENRPELGEPDIATEGPGESLEPGMKTMGGYEVRQGELVAYYILPYIEYGAAGAKSEPQLADVAFPEGSIRRALTQEDINALFGGADTLTTHLGWGGYKVHGWALWAEDGSFWGAFIYGNKGELDHFELAFTAGDDLPPTCFGHPDGVVNTLWDVPVTAYGWGRDNESGGGRIVEFLHGGYGFRFNITGTDLTQIDELASRITRWLILEGVQAQRITADGAVLDFYEANPNHSVGEPNWNDGADEYDSSCPYCVDGTVHTHPYNPGLPAADPDSPTTDGYSGGADPAPVKGPDGPAAGNLPDGDPAAYKPQAELPS